MILCHTLRTTGSSRASPLSQFLRESFSYFRRVCVTSEPHTFSVQASPASAEDAWGKAWALDGAGVSRESPQEDAMNRTTFIRSMQSKKRKRNPARKLKIRWEVLGLSKPQESGESASIDSIRQAVSSMASRGLGQGTRSRMKGAAPEEGSQARVRGTRRRGATE